MKGDLLDTRSTHAYYTQFLHDCCSIFRLQLVRFYMTCAMSMGSNLQSCDYSTPTNVIRQWQGKRKGRHHVFISFEVCLSCRISYRLLRHVRPATVLHRCPSTTPTFTCGLWGIITYHVPDSTCVIFLGRDDFRAELSLYSVALMNQ